MARFTPSLALRIFGAGVVLATAFSLQAPISSRTSTNAPAAKGLSFVAPMTPTPAAGLQAPVAAKNDFAFRLQSVAGGAAPAKKGGLVEKVCVCV